MLLSLSLQASRVKSSSFFTLWSADHFLHFFVVPVELWSSEIFWCLPLNQATSAYCQWKTRRLITKLIMQAARTVCVFSSPPPKPLPLLLVMPVTWFPGTQSIKSESDCIFNHSKSTAMLMVSKGACFSPLYLHFPLNPAHHLPKIWSYLQLYLLTARGEVFGMATDERKPTAYYKHVFLVLASFQGSSVSQWD